MSTLRHVTYNLLDYGPADDRDTRKRLEFVRETITATGGDVFSVQEICGPTPEIRAQTFMDLAETLRLDCMSTDQRFGQRMPVFDPGRGDRGVGVMWRPEAITAVPGSARIYDRAGFGVGMALVQLWVSGRVAVTVASTHWPPRLPRQRADEAVYVSVEIMDKGAHGIVGADWNNIFASRGDDGDYFDEDPYANRCWDHRYIAKARPVPHTGTGAARREAMHELHDGGLFDPAAYISAPRYRTTGHWKHAIDKRVDGPMVTESVAKATRSITAFEGVPAHEASDHLPVLLDFDLDLLVS